MLESQLKPIVGDVTLTLTEPQGTALASNFIIDGTQPFDLKVDWSQNGDTWILAPGGVWEVHALLEGLGNAYEGDLLTPRTVPAVATDHFVNTTTFSVPPNTVPAGVYELAVMITYEKSGPRALAGFETIKPLQVYYHV